MGNGMNKIIPSLYLGNLHDSRDQDQLNRNNITHILSAFDTATPILPLKKYMCLNVSDVATQDMTQHFRTAIDFIHDTRLTQASILVHCLAGVSRSSTLVIVYLMVITSFGWRDCLAAVRHCRPCVNPNFGFQKQLLDFQYNHLEEERKRFFEKYPDSIKMCQEDREIVAKLIKECKEEDEKEKKKMIKEEELKEKCESL